LPDSDSPYKTPDEFLNKMDLGQLDGKLCDELKKLTREQLENLAHALMERNCQLK
jgi:hypothetical protein